MAVPAGLKNDFFKVLFSLMVGPLPPPLRLNGTAKKNVVSLIVILSFSKHACVRKFNVKKTVEVTNYRSKLAYDTLHKA